MIEDLLYNSCREVRKRCYFHTERAFCYELYHRMMIFLENNHINLTLSAEIPKNFIDSAVTRKSFPDMVLHNDSNGNNQNMNNQYLVMEVKNIEQSNPRIVKDLIKIHSYMDDNNLRYENGVIILYSKNNTPSPSQTFITKINNILNINASINGTNIQLRESFNNIITGNKILYFVLVNSQDNNISNGIIYRFERNLQNIVFIRNL